MRTSIKRNNSSPRAKSIVMNTRFLNNNSFRNTLSADERVARVLFFSNLIVAAFFRTSSYLLLRRVDDSHTSTYHKTYAFSRSGRQKLQNAMCYDSYIFLTSPRPYISYKHAGYENYELTLSEEPHQ